MLAPNTGVRRIDALTDGAITCHSQTRSYTHALNTNIPKSSRLSILWLTGTVTYRYLCAHDSANCAVISAVCVCPRERYMSVRLFVIVYIQRPCSLNSPSYMCSEGVYFTDLLLVVTFSNEHAPQVILEHFVQVFPGTV